MADNEIIYPIKVDTKSAEQGIKTIDAKAAAAGGESGGIGKLNSAISSIGPAAMAAAAAFTTYLVGKALNEGISAAIEQENAINRMNQALSNMGRLSAESSKDMQNFASQIQATTTVGDEAALSYIALASAFTRSNAESKKLVSAAIDLSTAMGISVETAVRQLGGSLNGMVGTMGRVVPEVRNLTEAQLRAGDAIDLVAKKFSGSAAAAANTYDGKLKQLKNTFGDFLEEIGFFFTKSDSLRKAFGFVADAVKQLTARLGIFRESSGDIFKPILLGIGYVAKGIVFTLGPAFEGLYNFITVTGRGIAQLAAIMAEAFTGNFVGAAHLAKQAFNEGFNMKELLSTKGTESAMAYVDGFINQIKESEGLIQENLPDSMKGGGDGPIVPPPKPEETVQALALIEFAYEKLFGKVKFVAESLKKIYADMKKQLFATLVNGVGQAMNAVGQALVNGGNALTAFGKAMLSMFGQLATQLGMFYFMLGLATVYNDPARGAGMIAGGLALMVLGGVLQALGGGGGSTASASSSAGSTGTTSTAGIVGDSTVSQGDVADRERTTTINVNIAGSVLGDKRTLGLEIADALNDAFGNDGIIIARGAIS
jgi:hypothetical protein